MLSIPLPRGDHTVFELLDKMAPYLDIEKGPWVAGGVVRRILDGSFREDFDIDIFYASQEQYQETKEIFGQIGNPIGQGFLRSTANPPLQFCYKTYYATLDELFADIDFTICQMATDGRIIRGREEGFRDLELKRLVITPTATVKASTRIFRYFTYGFEPTETVLAVSDRLTDVHFYESSGKGFDGFDAAIEHLKNRDLTSMMELSRISDLVIEREAGFGTAYVSGYPMPAPMAFVYLSCPVLRQECLIKLRDLWNHHGLANSAPDASKIKPKRFFDDYRRAYADAGE